MDKIKCNNVIEHIVNIYNGTSYYISLEYPHIISSNREILINDINEYKSTLREEKLKQLGIK